jgi:hypothetical protein
VRAEEEAVAAEASRRELRKAIILEAGSHAGLKSNVSRSK